MGKMKSMIGQFGVVPDPPLPFECFDPKYFNEEICAYCIEHDDCKRIWESKENKGDDRIGDSND